jgi:hypothetical protein
VSGWWTRPPEIGAGQVKFISLRGEFRWFRNFHLDKPHLRTAAKNDQCTGGELKVNPEKSNGMAGLSNEVNCGIETVGE